MKKSERENLADCIVFNIHNDMYSFERVAHTFWREFASELLRYGASEEQVKYILRHKFMRWMLDGDQSLIEKAGRKMARDHMAKVGIMSAREEDK